MAPEEKVGAALELIHAATQVLMDAAILIDSIDATKMGAGAGLANTVASSLADVKTRTAAATPLPKGQPNIGRNIF